MGADGNPTSTLVDRWNGSAWTTTPSPDPSGTHDLLTAVTCPVPSSCWATGAYGVASGPAQQQQSTQPVPSSSTGAARPGRSSPAPT